MNATRFPTILLALALFGCMERSPENSARQVPILAAAMDCDTGRLKTLTEGLSQTALGQKAPGDTGGRPALQWAIQEGCDAGVDVLLEAGADPNLEADSSHSFGSTPLVYAAYGARREMVRRLLAHGADPHVRSGRDQLTPLFAAAAAGDPEIVRVLLSQGLDASDTGRDGLTPLHYGVPFPEVVRILVANGADVNAGNRSGTTPLMWLRSRDMDRVDVRESLRLLLAAGADLHARNRTGTTPLLSAVESDDPVPVRALLEAGADVNARDRSGQTSLAIVRERRQQRPRGFVRMLLRTFWSEFRESEEAELATLDEVESLLVDAGGQL